MRSIFGEEDAGAWRDIPVDGVVHAQQMPTAGPADVESGKVLVGTVVKFEGLGSGRHQVATEVYR